MIKIKTKDEIARMREAGRLAAAARELAGRTIQAGMTTRELDEIVRSYILRQGANLPSIITMATRAISVSASMMK